MTTRLPFVHATTALAAPARAQECAPAGLARKPGTMQASKLTGSTPGITGAERARERAALAGVHNPAWMP